MACLLYIGKKYCSTQLITLHITSSPIALDGLIIYIAPKNGETIRKSQVPILLAALKQLLGVKMYGS